MHQGRLLPLQIVRLEPASTSTATCHHIGVGDEGLPWAVKRVSDGRYAPLSDYICTRLAAEVGIAVPPCEVAELPNGEMAFASRWEGGVLADSQTRAQFRTPNPALTHALWRIHAFDLFVANPDRHAGNYLLRHDAASAGTMRCLAFDFGHALCAAGCPIPESLPEDCNTHQLWGYVVRSYPHAPHEAVATLEKLSRLPGDSIDRLCQSLPGAWADSNAMDALGEWWKDARPGRLARIATYFERWKP